MGTSTTLRLRVVNGRSNGRGPLAPKGRPRIALLSLPALCITLDACQVLGTNCMGLASETGIRCKRLSWRLIPGLPPQR